MYQREGTCTSAVLPKDPKDILNETDCWLWWNSNTRCSVKREKSTSLPQVIEVMRFFNLCLSLGWDSFVFGILFIITNVELFCYVEVCCGHRWHLCANPCLFSNKVSLFSKIFLMERTKAMEIGRALWRWDTQHAHHAIFDVLNISGFLRRKAEVCVTLKRDE